MSGEGEKPKILRTGSWRDSIGQFAHLAKNRTVDQKDEVEFAIDSAMREQEERSRGEPAS